VNELLPISKDRPPLWLRRLAFLKLARGDDFLDQFDESLIDEAKSLGADILVFPDRPWMGESLQLPLHDTVSIALLSFDGFEDWITNLPRSRRKQIRRSSEEGVEVRTVDELSASEAQEVLGLFREAPFREGRYFTGYHSWSLPQVTEEFKTNDRLVSSVAVHDGKIVGVSKYKFKGQVAVSTNQLTSLAVRRKVHGVANLLLAHQIKMLAGKGVKHLKYGKLGAGLDSLDEFKTSNGFRPVNVHYNYVLLTPRAKLSAKLGIYQPWDLLFSTKLQPVVPLLGSVQPHLPIKLIQKFHLYA
jgi:hypothetical protein